MATAFKRDPAKVGRGGTFRIVAGDHLGDGPPGCECDACLTSGGKNHRYRARLYDDKGRPRGHNGEKFASDDERTAYEQSYDNDIIESKVDLTKEPYSWPHAVKFVRVEDSQQQLSQSAPAAFPLERMTVAQMFLVAEDEGINLQGATTREDVIRMIQAARNGGTASSNITSSEGDDHLDSLNITDLRSIAESENVPPPADKRQKDEWVKAIRQSRQNG